jgi:hypothetical protein
LFSTIVLQPNARRLDASTVNPTLASLLKSQPSDPVVVLPLAQDPVLPTVEPETAEVNFDRAGDNVSEAKIREIIREEMINFAEEFEKAQTIEFNEIRDELSVIRSQLFKLENDN